MREGRGGGGGGGLKLKFKSAHKVGAVGSHGAGQHSAIHEVNIKVHNCPLQKVWGRKMIGSYTPGRGKTVLHYVIFLYTPGRGKIVQCNLYTPSRGKIVPRNLITLLVKCTA